MQEIVLSDITIMAHGYCVVGLKQLAPGVIQSVRPRPPVGFAWHEPFTFERGQSVQCSLTAVNAIQPHIEDHLSAGLTSTGRSLSEEDLVSCLTCAEISPDLKGLFGCGLRSDSRGGNVWADPKEARRSICGCRFNNIWFLVFEEPERLSLRARLALPSNERLNSIPVVDREWRRFLQEVVNKIKSEGRPYGAEQSLNRFVRRHLMRSLNRFARIGLARPEKGSGKCWLMLDSLFPQPQESWLDGL